jgi:hypothetical protein
MEVPCVQAFDLQRFEQRLEQALSQQLPLRLIEAASRIITAAVKAVPVKQIGYSRLISTLTFS